MLCPQTRYTCDIELHFDSCVGRTSSPQLETSACSGIRNHDASVKMMAILPSQLWVADRANCMCVWVIVHLLWYLTPPDAKVLHLALS